MSGEEIREAVERWRNSDGFASTDEHECFEMVYRLAAAYIAGLDAKTAAVPRKAVPRPTPNGSEVTQY